MTQVFLACSFPALLSHLSIIKGPKGNMAATIPAAARRREMGTRRVARMNMVTSAMNSKPCTDPAIVTAPGLPAMYLSGMATPNRTSVEIPSIVPISLSFERKFGSLLTLVLDQGGSKDYAVCFQIDSISHLEHSTITSRRWPRSQSRVRETPVSRCPTKYPKVGNPPATDGFSRHRAPRRICPHPSCSS